MDDVTIILRECGERTADASYELLCSIVPTECVYRVNEVPFSQAVRRAFEIGLERNRTWTLCIDADVLVSERGVLELLAVARLQPSNVFELQGFIADKFFGHFRPAGNHLYRTELLKDAIRYIPIEGSTLRPEHTTILAMREAGCLDMQLPTIVGIHDYEQFYTDIYRKCFLQAHKHAWLREFLTQRWEALATSDNDYRVALLAFQQGESHGGDVFIDKRFLQETASEHVKQLGIIEKSALETSVVHQDAVAAAIHGMLDATDFELIKHQARLIHHYFVEPKLPAQRSKSLLEKTKRRVLAIPRKLRKITTILGK